MVLYNSEQQKEDSVVDAIIEASEMDIPEMMVATQQREMLDEFAQRLQYQGMNIEQYFQYTGSNAEMMMDQIKPQALKKIKTQLVLEAIVDAEKIEVSDDEYAAEIKKLAESYGMEEDKVKETLLAGREELFKKDLAMQKAVDFVTENAKEK